MPTLKSWAFSEFYQSFSEIYRMPSKAILIIQLSSRQPGRLWTVLNHFYSSLPPGLSKKSAYRLNVTLMASATRTVITRKIFCSHKAYILSQKAFKVAPVSGATLNAYQHALNLHLLAQSCHVFDLEHCGVANFSTLDPLRNFLTDFGSNPDSNFYNNTPLWNTPIQNYTSPKNSNQ